MALEWVLRMIQVGPLGVRRIQLGPGGLHNHHQRQLWGLHKNRFPQLAGLHKNHLGGPRGPGGHCKNQLLLVHRIPSLFLQLSGFQPLASRPHRSQMIGLGPLGVHLRIQGYLGLLH